MAVGRDFAEITVPTGQGPGHNKTPTDSGLRLYPSAFRSPSAFGIAPGCFRRAMNVHPLFLNVNTFLMPLRKFPTPPADRAARTDRQAKQNADKSDSRQIPRRLLGLWRLGVATRLHLACYERTPSVPRCQYPFHTISQIASPVASID